MNIFDEILKQQHLIEARGNSLAIEIIGELEKALDYTAQQIINLRVKMLKANREYELQPLTRRKAYLEALEQEIKRAMQETFITALEPKLLECLADSYIFAGQQVQKMFSPLKISIPQIYLSQETLRAFITTHEVGNVTLQKYLSGFENYMKNKIVEVGKQCAILNLSHKKMSKMLREEGIPRTRPAIEAISRTFLLSASNYAREENLKQFHGLVDFKYLYTATLDGRTCPLCGLNDGKEYAQNEERPQVPRHISCRCTYIPVLEDSIFPDKPERPAVKHSEKTVHHKDGSTSTKYKVDSVTHTKENYSQWISRQLKEDPEFVQKILGKSRYELLRDGKITLEKMVVDGKILKLLDII